MSYGGAGQPAPSSGSPSGYAFFKALFDHIFAQFNADDALITAASITGAPNQLVKANAAGDIAAARAFVGQAVNLGVVAGADGLTVNASGITGTNRYPLNIYDTGGNLLVLNGLRTLNFGTGANPLKSTHYGLLTVHGTTALFTAATDSPSLQLGSLAGQTADFLTAYASDNTTVKARMAVDGSITATAFHGPADSALALAAPVPLAQLADLRLTVTGASTVISYAAGSYVNDNGVEISINAGTATPVIPTMGNQWAVLSFDPNGNPHFDYGTLGGVQSTAAVTKGNRNPVWVYLRQNCTALFATDQGTAGTGYIKDRPWPAYGSGSGGGGTGTGLSVTDPVVAIGALGDDSNATDIYSLAAGTATGTVNGNNLVNFYQNVTRIRSESPTVAANAPALADFFGQSPGAVALHPRSYLSAGGNSVYLNPCVIAINGVLKSSGAAIQTATVTPSAGIYYAYADYTGRTDGTFALILSTTNPTLTLQRQLLATLRHNGSYFLGDPFVDWQPLLEVTSTQMRPFKAHYSGYSGQAITGTTQTEVTVATQTIEVARTMDIVLNGYFTLTASVAGSGQMFAQFDSTVIGVPSEFNESGGVWTRCIPFGGELDGQVPGTHLLRVYVKLAAGSCTAYTGAYNLIAWCP